MELTDPVEVRRRLDRFRERVARRDAYGTMLARGTVYVSREDVEDTQQWRREMVARARADRVKIRTGLTKDGHPWAAVMRPDVKEVVEEERLYYHGMLAEVTPVASALRHQPVVLLRDGWEVVFICERCDALALCDITPGAGFRGGELFEDTCTAEGDPAPTSLTVRFGDASGASRQGERDRKEKGR